MSSNEAENSSVVPNNYITYATIAVKLSIVYNNNNNKYNNGTEYFDICG